MVWNDHYIWLIEQQSYGKYDDNNEMIVIVVCARQKIVMAMDDANLKWPWQWIQSRNNTGMAMGGENLKHYDSRWWDHEMVMTGHWLKKSHGNGIVRWQHEMIVTVVCARQKIVMAMDDENMKLLWQWIDSRHVTAELLKTVWPDCKTEMQRLTKCGRQTETDR